MTVYRWYFGFIVKVKQYKGYNLNIIQNIAAIKSSFFWFSFFKIKKKTK